MKNNGHITLDEIEVQKKTLESKIESAIDEYTKATGLTPIIEVNNIYGSIGYNPRAVVNIEINITQKI